MLRSWVVRTRSLDRCHLSAFYSVGELYSALARGTILPVERKTSRVSPPIGQSAARRRPPYTHHQTLPWRVTIEEWRSSAEWGVPLRRGAARSCCGSAAASAYARIGGPSVYSGGGARACKQVAFGTCGAFFHMASTWGIFLEHLSAHIPLQTRNVVALDGLGSVRRIADLKHRFTAQWMHTSISSCQVARRPEESHARTSRDGTWTLSLDLSVA